MTGAAGFVGRRLCEYLHSQGHEVVALLRRSAAAGSWHRSFCCELGREALPNGLMEGVDGVFHLANLAHADPADCEADKYWRVNVAGTEALLTAARQAGVGSFIYFSSVKAVVEPGKRCVDENWDGMPTDPYGRSKREAERRVLSTGAACGMHVCNLRPALVYGPGVKGNLFRMLRTVARRRFPPLPDFGNRRSMVSLDDLITAAWLSATSPKANGRTYIVADGVDYSPRELYEAILRALGMPLPRWRIPGLVLRFAARAGDGVSWMLRRRMPLDSAVLSRLKGSACYRSDLIREELGWKPVKNLYDALPEMVEDICGQGESGIVRE